MRVLSYYTLASCLYIEVYMWFSMATSRNKHLVLHVACRACRHLHWFLRKFHFSFKCPTNISREYILNSRMISLRCFYLQAILVWRPKIFVTWNGGRFINIPCLVLICQSNVSCYVDICKNWNMSCRTVLYFFTIVLRTTLLTVRYVLTRRVCTCLYVFRHILTFLF